MFGDRGQFGCLKGRKDRIQNTGPRLRRGRSRDGHQSLFSLSRKRGAPLRFDSIAKLRLAHPSSPYLYHLRPKDGTGVARLLEHPKDTRWMERQGLALACWVVTGTASSLAGNYPTASGDEGCRGIPVRKRLFARIDGRRALFGSRWLSVARILCSSCGTATGRGRGFG